MTMKRGRTEQKDDSSAFEDRVIAFARRVGWVYGAAEARAEVWLDRERLERELIQIRDGAAELLDHLAERVEGTETKRGPRKKAGAAAVRDHAASQPAPPMTKRQPAPRGIKHSDEMVSKAKRSSMRVPSARRG
jgi:hypothetical protein